MSLAPAGGYPDVERTRRELYFFFASFAGLPASIAKAFTFSNSLTKPFEKPAVPYSKSTTNENAKKTKSAIQKRPRSKDMRLIVAYRVPAVNAAARRSKFPLKQEA